jgi:hypothetical protein
MYVSAGDPLLWSALAVYQGPQVAGGCPAVCCMVCYALDALLQVPDE